MSLDVFKLGMFLYIILTIQKVIPQCIYLPNTYFSK